MGKNIVLCADGTGNRGGYTPASNVYKTYTAVDVHTADPSQVVFYDNGVGTSTNKHFRAVTGSLGFGFAANVLDLYRFLARHYEDGDDVYLFGFSRGAATVRAFSGMVAAVGLVDGRTLSEEDLEHRIHHVFRSYKAAGYGLAEPNPNEGSHGAIPIRFLGVWDTVSALGFPQNWDITGVGMWVLNGLFKALDHASDMLFPHRFYNYELTGNVAAACQALAIDDERNTFQPMVWDETHSPETAVEQVWFAGAHSNVGGGYGRAGLANVSLDWMMDRASNAGLAFKKHARDEVRRDMHVHGRLYDSRDGLAIYFRYHPREIDKLCEGRLRGRIKIHDSVFERMRDKTGNYAPGRLPFEFEIVSNNPEAPGREATAAESAEVWAVCRTGIARWVFRRKWLYGVFVEATLAIIISSWWFWKRPPAPAQVGTGFVASVTQNLETLLDYVLPVFFEGLVTVAVVQNSWLALGAIVFFLALLLLRVRWRHKEVRACEVARKVLLEELD